MWLSEWLKTWNNTHSIPMQTAYGFWPYRFPWKTFFCWSILGDRHRWELKFPHSPQEAFKLASKNDFDLILCNRSQPGHPWREVMDRLAASSPRSCILLVSPTKDDYLWWEVLHHRGFDVLIHPLREEMVLRVVDTARRCLSPTLSCT